MKKVWLLRDVLDQICYEAESKYSLETGGLLVGYISADDDDVVITDAVGPGPKAKHSRRTYIPDYLFHKEEIRRIFHGSGGLHTYLGDWHSHPNAPAYLSFLDKRALQNIARFPGNYIDRPIMLVLGGTGSDVSSEWKPAVWRISPRPHLFPWYRWDYVPLEITLFEEY